MTLSPAPPLCRLLFVYGTLRRNFDHPMARFLSENAEYLGEARVPGRLCDLGHYPGMIPAIGDGEWVYGDLFEMRDPEATLAELDRYEGCPLPGEPAQFERSLVDVRCANGEWLVAWAYWYRGQVTQEQWIANGAYPFA